MADSVVEGLDVYFVSGALTVRERQRLQTIPIQSA